MAAAGLPLNFPRATQSAQMSVLTLLLLTPTPVQCLLPLVSATTKFPVIVAIPESAPLPVLVLVPVLLLVQVLAPILARVCLRILLMMSPLLALVLLTA